MREIKFRVWDGVNMIYPDWIAIHESGKYWQVKPNDNYDAEEYPLMQFTGLRDKNGKEVYEGDIVICSAGCSHEIIFGGMNGMPGWWLKGTLIGPMGDYSWTRKHEEVIGNIYEHSHLLEQNGK